MLPLAEDNDSILPSHWPEISNEHSTMARDQIWPSPRRPCLEWAFTTINSNQALGDNHFSLVTLSLPTLYQLYGMGSLPTNPVLSAGFPSLFERHRELLPSPGGSVSPNPASELYLSAIFFLIGKR